MGKVVIVLLAVVLTSCRPADTEQITIAVASNFVAPMREILAAFATETGHDVVLASGSSGAIYAQIHNGAPFALFFSADQEKPAALQADGLGTATRFTYAVGRLVLWSPREGYITDGIERLREGDFEHLALANPRLAPYGLAALQVLRALDLEDQTRGTWVQGENIAQTYQFVSSGNARLGFVALSQVLDRDTGAVREGSAWRVPQDLHEPIRQDVVLLEQAATSVVARALLDFMRGEQAREIIRSYGYDVEDAAGGNG